MLNKPINPYPYNCCVDSSKNIEFGYEIPNNETIDYSYNWITNLKTGDSKLDVLSEFSTPSNTVSFVVNSEELSDNKEYAWQSFYWKEPQSNPDKTWVVSGKDNDSGDIYLQPSGEPISTIVPTYKESWFTRNYGGTPVYIYNGNLISDDVETYTSADFKECGHTSGDDTSKHCMSGNLEDYFNYRFFKIGEEFANKIIDIGLGKCVINIYKDDVLIARTRCLAYDYNKEKDYSGGRYYIIIDNKDFISDINSGCDGNTIIVSYVDDMSGVSHDLECYQYTSVSFYNIDNLDDSENIQNCFVGSPNYSIVTNSIFSEYHYIINTKPHITQDINIGDKIDVFSHNSAEYNESPAYYFRVKKQPIINITQSKLENVNDKNVLNDVRCNFGINFSSSDCALNCFYLYLYVFDHKKYTWELQERSPMLFDENISHEFIGFANGQKYKVIGVCTDKDGDEWNADELEFDVSISSVTSDATTLFDKNKTTIDVSFGNILKAYKIAELELYKALKDDVGSPVKLEYSGGGFVKSNDIVYFDKLHDYNIRNDSYYDYYLRINYTGKQSDDDKGVDFFAVGSDIHTQFEGISILGLEKSNDVQLNILHNFNLFCYFENELSELKNEISREYLNSFGKYPKELKGNQNYISGSCSGLLGKENKGEYDETRFIRDEWIDFINNDSIKLYRGVDGKTMIISIDSSSVKPHYFSSVGIVNEVHFTFKEIALANQYAIFSTEKTGD